MSSRYFPLPLTFARTRTSTVRIPDRVNMWRLGIPALREVGNAMPSRQAGCPNIPPPIRLPPPLRIPRLARFLPSFSPSPSAMASRSTIFRLINASQHSASCPCHGGKPHVHLPQQVAAVGQLRKLATPVKNVEKEYAFEVRMEV